MLQSGGNNQKSPTSGRGGENKQFGFFGGTLALTLKKEKKTLALTLKNKNNIFLVFVFSSVWRVTCVTLERNIVFVLFFSFYTRLTLHPGRRHYPGCHHLHYLQQASCSVDQGSSCAGIPRQLAGVVWCYVL